MSAPVYAFAGTRHIRRRTVSVYAATIDGRTVERSKLGYWVNGHYGETLAKATSKARAYEAAVADLADLSFPSHDAGAAPR